MHRDRLFRLVYGETDYDIGWFASVQECHRWIRRHGLTAWKIWLGHSLIESADPDAEYDTPSAPVMLAVMQTLAVSR